MTSRVLLTLATLGLAVGGYALMLRGWRRRSRAQAGLPAPAQPSGDAGPVVSAVRGLFVGTVGADHWLDRIAVHRLSDRARGALRVDDDGVHVTRDQLPELFVPLGALEAVGVEKALAGKVVSSGLLVLTWRLGDRSLASAFRADDPADHGRLRDTLTALLPVEVA